MIKKICSLLIVFLLLFTVITSVSRPSFADGNDIPEAGVKPPVTIIP